MPEPIFTDLEPTPPAPRTAGIALRAAAVIVDGILIFILLGGVIAGLAGQTSNASNNGETIGFHLHGAPAVLWLVLSFAYWIGCESAFGMTLGKRLFSIRVERADGARPSIGQSIARNLLRIVDGFPYIVPYLIGFVVAMASSERQRVGDRAAGTHVVRRD
jgi:uncharacterized RDD family membrane protein YckC